MSLTPSEVEPEVAGQRYVVFTLLGERYALPVASVREVIDAPALTRVPRAPSCVEGIVNLRGSVVPVVHLGRRLGLEEGATPRCIVFVEWQNEVVGLLVDEVVAVISLTEFQTEGLRSGPGSAADDFVSAVSRQEDGRLIVVLDLQKLLDLRER